MAADRDRLGPPGHGLGDRRADDRLAENGAVEDVTDRAVRRPPLERGKGRVSLEGKGWKRRPAQEPGRTICLSLNSSTRASSGVMVAHCEEAGKAADTSACRSGTSRRARHGESNGRRPPCCAPRAVDKRGQKGRLPWTDLDADVVLLDGLSALDSDAVVGPVALLHAEVKVLDVELEVGQDQLRRGRAGSTSQRIGNEARGRSVVLAPKERGERRARETRKRQTFIRPDSCQLARDVRTSSRIFFQMMRVISSPSSSTTGLATWILASAWRMAADVAKAGGADPRGDRSVCAGRGSHSCVQEHLALKKTAGDEKRASGSPPRQVGGSRASARQPAEGGYAPREGTEPARRGDRTAREGRRPKASMARRSLRDGRRKGGV
jgi:hypothetical protein